MSTQQTLSTLQATGLEVVRSTPAIGGEVRGLDLSQPLDEATFAALHDALMDRQVLFFRDQDITLEQQVALGKRFGPLHVHPAAPSLPGHPEIFVIHADEKSKNVAGNFWHSDVSCDEEPPLGTLLHLHQIPSSGGDTLFASMTAAYEDLSDAMQRFLEGLVAVHESEHIYRGRYTDRGGNDDTARYPVAEHPVVREHPVTGRKALYVNEVFTTRIKGLKPTESKAVLEMLFAHCHRPEFTVRFQWQANSIAFWDNRVTQHYALWDYFPEVRHGLRVTVQGDRPFGPAMPKGSWPKGN